ncbi:hypothetical protein HanRHA438_Chr12g0553741 [Helianthus annuus]|nr:hypothetical protein HanHA89_Chr12g0469821 [Helianthus annuus]KAJ0862793.1 hypothetical protein HanPSC8_Chr12g0522441 [Helianthus annuus]KAJ0866607.1 hypothetical protein HanRHA438_Chr12g0553741 [Helianthus annuus]
MSLSLDGLELSLSCLHPYCLGCSQAELNRTEPNKPLFVLGSFTNQTRLID